MRPGRQGSALFHNTQVRQKGAVSQQIASATHQCAAPVGSSKPGGDGANTVTNYRKTAEKRASCGTIFLRETSIRKR